MPDPDAKYDEEVSSALAWAEQQLGTPTVEAQRVWGEEGAMVLRLGQGPEAAFLKVGGLLVGEAMRLQWLKRHLPDDVPALLGLNKRPRGDWLLTRALPGADLSRPEHLAQPERLIRLLAQGLRRLHELDVRRCPWGDIRPGFVVVHGDAVLPNVLADGDCFCGYVDLADLRVGSPEVDLAAAIWSLDHNLGPGWGAPFLSLCGSTDSDEAVGRLQRAYGSRLLDSMTR